MRLLACLLVLMLGTGVARADSVQFSVAKPMALVLYSSSQTGYVSAVYDLENGTIVFEAPPQDLEYGLPLIPLEIGRIVLKRGHLYWLEIEGPQFPAFGPGLFRLEPLRPRALPR
jgi:hypothetical protein